MRRLVLILIAALLFPLAGRAQDTVPVPLADRFDFPVGKPDAKSYYKARGYRPNGHLGEDWNGRSGGNSDKGDPVYAIGNGIVVLAVDYKLGWGNVVIMRHAYFEGGEVRFIDSLYGHLDQLRVTKGQVVSRGFQIGTIGNNRGMYSAHLHFEIRKNITIGMQRSSFAKDFSNYFDPTKFINSRRTITGGPTITGVAINTFHFPQTPGESRTEVVQGGSSSPAPNVRQRISAKGSYFKVDRYDDMVR